jgi:tetratricopeptide (TPR) repeat protein
VEPDYWSWSLLADWEQSALAQLSVFRDGFFLESAEAVLDLSDYPDAPWVLDVVSALLDKSLLHSREVLGQPRFRMYLSVREFAEQQLADRDLSGETRQRHAAHFSVLGSEEAIRSLSCHAGLQRRRQLEVELDNCRVAAEHAVHLPDPAVAVGCTMAVAVFLVYSGPFAVGVQLVDPVLDHPGIGERGRLRLFQVRGDLQFYAGQLSSAEQDYRQAIARGRSLEVPRHLVRAMNGLGSLLLQQGRLEESREIIEQAIQVGVNAKAPGLEIHSRRNLAILHRESDGELDYRSVLFESLRYDREQGNRSAEAMDLANIAISEMETGEADRAEEHYRASLAIHGELGNRRLQSITRGNLANLVKKQGRSEEALELYRQALQGLREAGDRRASGHVLSNFGNLYRQQGQLDDAERCLVEAMSIARELENPRGLAVGLGNLGDVLLDQGRLDEAREYLVEAIEQCEVSYALPGGAFKASLALIEAHAGKYTEAKALLDAGEQILRGAHTEELAKLLCKRGMVALMAGDRVQAVDALEEARAIRLEIGAGMDSELGSLLLQFEQGLTESD